MKIGLSGFGSETGSCKKIRTSGAVRMLKTVDRKTQMRQSCWHRVQERKFLGVAAKSDKSTNAIAEKTEAAYNEQTPIR